MLGTIAPRQGSVRPIPEPPTGRWSFSSRPYLVGLIERGEIPARKVGSRRRLRLADVLLYRDIDQARRLAAARDLAVEAQELGIY